ncbi:bifunctional diaminohydroxyphosphoribosylaminopyrimidine deaminase/5-amino-6-(5-phosphoribosylamino)uracil reductase RibD [candidate division FCPU426 bacterium]|nr:bifunctional diaminohydroxyphosphoribosylaminopyrimidine deaminase/5-amino-6-(5-phosphoribosylamino)uracil reductase RibD [candidate division FCPU426 bacterium]
MRAAPDEKYMRRALQLAAKGRHQTWPNPMVGAVVVKAGVIVGEGWHEKYGGSHAEIHALHHAGTRAAGATLYLNLEPCAHYGKTPPCVEAVIQSGITRVVCAMKDPNPKVCGRGFLRLRSTGIRVEAGLLQAEARELNKVFIKIVTTPHPYVINKAGMSLDGKIACYNGSSRWITGLQARVYAHRLRQEADAVLVGAGTVFRDDPRLNVRLVKNPGGSQPWRVLLEGKRRLPPTLKIFASARRQKTVIATTRRVFSAAAYPDGVEHWLLPGREGCVDINALLLRLREEGVYSLLVEGGAEVHAAFLGLHASNPVCYSDEMHLVMAMKIIGGRDAPGAIGGQGAGSPQKALLLKRVRWAKMGEDQLLVSYLRQGRK